MHAPFIKHTTRIYLFNIYMDNSRSLYCTYGHSLLIYVLSCQNSVRIGVVVLQIEHDKFSLEYTYPHACIYTYIHMPVYTYHYLRHLPKVLYLYCFFLPSNYSGNHALSPKLQSRSYSNFDKWTNGPRVIGGPDQF